MKITVMNRHNAAKYNPNHNIAIISITDPYSMPNQFVKENIDILRLSFDDIDFMPMKNAKGEIIEECSFMVLFKRDHAKQILDFYLKVKDTVDELVVHCEAGRSRSAGTAAALLFVSGQNDRTIFCNPLYHPNMRVYRTILEEAGFTFGY